MAKNSAKYSAKNGTSTKGPGLAPVLTVLWQTIRRDAFASYRPELHYMRGPGPKWHAKHGLSAADRAPALGDTAVAI